MNYIIVDLEATCWEQKGPMSEIIEIGAVCVNEDRQIESQFSEFVKPVMNPQLSAFCTQLTTITQEEVDKAATFPEVIRRFKSWIHTGDDGYTLCSWGFYDKSQFNKDCRLHNLETSWLKPHISLKHQYAEIRGLEKGVGMSQALRNEGLRLQGTHHRGIDDAINITEIFRLYFDRWKFK